MSNATLDQLNQLEELTKLELETRKELAAAPPQSVAQSVPLGVKSGFWRGVAGFNRMLGLGAFDTTKRVFIDPLEKKAQEYEDQIKVQNNTDRFITSLAQGVGGLGATLPADVMTGGMIRAGMVGRMTPAAQEFLSHVPDFAIGMWARGSVAGAQKEGTIPEKTLHMAADGFEELVHGAVYHKVGTGITKTPLYFAVGAAQATNDALKEGRLPTWEEIVDRAGHSVAFNVVMTAVGNATGVAKSPTEKAAAEHMRMKLQRGRPISEDIAEILESDKFSPEFKDQVEKVAEAHAELPTKRVIAPPKMETAVREENGVPKRVFHGTDKEFAEFEYRSVSGNLLYGPGFYFTEDADIAAEYSVYRSQEGSNIRPAYLEIKNPLDMDAPPEPKLLEEYIRRKATEDAALELSLDWKFEGNREKELDRRIKVNEELYRQGVATGQVHIPTNSRLHVLLRDYFGIEDEQIAFYKKFGYDGITHTGGHIMGNKEHRVWIAWEPEQIKPGFDVVEEVPAEAPAPVPSTTTPLKPADESLYPHRKSDTKAKFQLDQKELNDLSDALLSHQRGEIDESAIVNLRIGNFTTNEEARDAIYYIHERLGAISAEKTGGMKPLAETAEGASKISFTKEAFRALRKRVTGLDEAITAARASMIFSAQRLIELKTAVLGGEEGAKEKYTEWLNDHAEIKIEFDAIKKEAGRAVSSFRIDVLAQEIMEATDLAGMKKILSKFRGPKYMNAILEGWKSGLFWGPVTHAVNLLGSAATMLGEQVEYGIAAARGWALGTENRIRAREVGARAIGLGTGMVSAGKYVAGMMAGAAKEVKTNVRDKGFVEAAKLGEAFMNDTSIDPYHNKFNSARYAISQEHLRTSEPAPSGFSFADILWKGLDSFGMLTRTSFTLLGAEDNFMKGAMYESSISGIAIREAMRLKLSGGKMNEFMDRFIKAHKMHLESNLKPLSAEQERFVNEFLGDGRYHVEAMNDARRAIFGQQFGGESMINNMLRGVERTLNGAPFLQFVVPVFKAVTNIMKYVGRRTPLLNRLSSEMTADFEAGGRRRDLAYARLAYGTMLYIVGGYLAYSGRISGARPKDMRQSDQAAGVQQYSYQTDEGEEVEYGRVDPVASFFGLPANMFFLAEHLSGSGAVEEYEWDEAVGYTILALSSLYLDKSYAKGIKDALDALSDDRGHRAASWARNFGSSFIPLSGMWNYIASKDSVFREAHTFQEALLKRVKPSALNPALDIFGKVQPRLPNTAGILKTSQLSSSPIRKELVRLELNLSDPSMYFKPGVKMTDEQNYKMREILGKLGLEEDLNRRIMTPYYRYGLRDDPGSSLPGTKGWMIRNVVNAYRANAKYIMNQAEGDTLIEQTRAALYGVNSKEYNDGETLGWGKFLQRWQTK